MFAFGSNNSNRTYDIAENSKDNKKEKGDLLSIYTFLRYRLICQKKYS